MKFSTLLGLNGLLALAAFGLTPLPFQDNLNSLDPACVSARPNSGGEVNDLGCGEWRQIGLTYPTSGQTFSLNTTRGEFECTYTRNEDQCRAQIQFAETDVLYSYWELTYGSDYDFAAGQKIMRWSAYNFAGGTNYTDHIMYTTHDTTSSTIVNGRHNSKDLCMERNNGSQYDCISFNFVRGHKYRFKTKQKMNTVGQANGEFVLEIDGVRLMSKTNLSSMRVAAGDTHGLNIATVGGWYSASTPVRPSTYWIDNPRFSTTDDFQNWPVPGSTPPVPPVVVASADTVITVLRDTTKFLTVRTQKITDVYIPMPTIASSDTTVIRDTIQVQ